MGGRYRVPTARAGGARWDMGGVYEVVEPGRRLAYSVAWSAPMGCGPVPERVEVTFRPQGAGCAITFCHEGGFGAVAGAEHAKGWEDTFDALARWLAATG